MLKTELRERGDVVIADLTGRLTLGPGDRAVHDLVEGFLHAGGRNLVLNLSGIEYIDSSGVGELVRSLRTVRSRGARLKILNPSGRVYDTLSLARLLPLFEVFQSEDEVVQSFATAASESERDVLFEVADRVATITLNRPKRHNSLTRSSLSELVSVFHAARRDKDVRAIVLTGAGGRAFCFGADVEELREGMGIIPTLELLQTVVRDITLLPKPVICAINGFASGAGFDLVLACDLRVMSEKAKLASAFVKLGLVPDGGSTHALPRLVGPVRAAEIVLGGRPIEAEEALRWGLVNRVLPAGEVLASAQAWAHELAQGPPRAMGRAKLLLYANPIGDLSTALVAEAREQTTCFGESEFQEGFRAYVERRNPVFPE